MDLSKYSPKDRKIIASNPGVSAYDLLQKELSQKGYERLTADQAAEPTATPEPAAPVKEEVLTPAAIAQVSAPKAAKPVLSKATTTTNHSTAKLYNKRTGRAVPMNTKIAQRMAQQHPDQYKIQ